MPPPTDPAATLRELLAQYGAELADDPRRCAALFRDVWPEGGPHVAVLLGAVEEQVPGDLMRSSTPIGPRIEQLAARLAQQRGLSTDMADWAVRTWAVALGRAAPAPPRPGPLPGPGQRPPGPQGPPAGGVASTQVPPPQAPRQPQQPGHWGGEWPPERRPVDRQPKHPVGLIVALTALGLIAIGVIAFATFGGKDPEVATDTTTEPFDPTTTTSTSTTTTVVKPPAAPVWTQDENELLAHVVGNPPQSPACKRAPGVPTGATAAITCTSPTYTRAWLYKFGGDDLHAADYTARVEQSGLPRDYGVGNEACTRSGCEGPWRHGGQQVTIGRRLIHGDATGTWLVLTLDNLNITIVAFRNDGNKQIVYDMWFLNGTFTK